MNKDLTFGEKAVGLSFNPSGDKDVEYVKTICAEFIDFCDHMRISTLTDSEQKRMLSIAITECQTAQMWAVKAITWGK